MQLRQLDKQLTQLGSSVAMLKKNQHNLVLMHPVQTDTRVTKFTVLKKHFSTAFRYHLPSPYFQKFLVWQDIINACFTSFVPDHDSEFIMFNTFKDITSEALILYNLSTYHLHISKIEMTE